MEEEQHLVYGSVVLAVVAALHASIVWPPRMLIAMFGGGACIAFLAEYIVIRGGLLEHHIGYQLAGVPIYVLFGWTGTIYVAFQVAAIVTSGWVVPIGTALLATTWNVLTDHQGVRAEFWTYTHDIAGPTYRGVPWWNFVGWFLVSFITAALVVFV